MRNWTIGMALGLSVLLGACGGGGGSAGTTAVGSSGGGAVGGSTPTTSTATLSVSDFAVYTDKTTINNSGNDKAQVTVVAVDAGRNVVSGATVSVSADANTIFTPAAGNTTGADGTYTGALAIGSDKTDRDVTITVSVNGITKRTGLRVTGTKITLQASPNNPAPGQAVTLTATVLDSSGNPMPGVTVKLGGSLAGVSGQSLITSANGTATRSFTAPSVTGAYNVSATAGAVSAADYQISVFSSAIPSAVIPVGAAPSLSASPNVLAVNAPGATANRSTLRFLFLDGQNRPLPNVRVRFEDRTTGLAAVGASLVSGATTLYTDASGTATTQYVAGQNASPTNGVVVRACYSASDFVSSTDCPNSVSATMTIGGQALALSIGDDNLLQKGAGTYIKNFTITVADSAGRAVANAPVDISVDLTHYSKGFFRTETFVVSPPSGLTEASPDFVTAPTEEARIWCPNEDTNRNGNVDPGENINQTFDTNGQPTLEPRKSDLIVSYADPAVTTTNASGLLVIKVEYSQRFATWLAYRVRVTANVAGSQGLAERLFTTDYVEGDDKNGSFLNPPYGSMSCSAPN